jgi:hypothetical protein
MTTLVRELNAVNLVHESESAHKGIQSRQDKLKALRKALTELLSNENLTGKAADSLASYVREVHLNGILKSLETLLQTFDDSSIQYVSDYSDVDSATNAHLLSDELDTHKSQIAKAIGQFDEAENHLSQIVKSVSSIYVPESHQSYVSSARTVSSSLKDMQSIVKELSKSWKSYEQSNYFRNVAALLADIEKAIHQYQGKSLKAVSGYVSGSFGSQNLDMIYGSQELAQIHAQNAKSFADAWKNIKKVDDAEVKQEQENKDRGFWEEAFGAVAVIVGAAAIIFTAGAATPIVAAAWVSGLSAGAYGVSNMIEGSEIQVTGADKAFNPLRDTVFQGNQAAYDTFGTVAMLAAGSVIPVGAAVEAGQALTSSLVVSSVGKVGIAALAGVATNAVVTPAATSIAKGFGANDIQANDIGTATGFVVSAVVGGKAYGTADDFSGNIKIDFGKNPTNVLEHSANDASQVQGVKTNFEDTPAEVKPIKEETPPPPERPSWRQSETDYGAEHPDYSDQVSFKDGVEVPRGTKGSTRPDFYKDGTAVEIKNYDISSSQGRSNLLRTLKKQLPYRQENLPEGTTQKLVLDVRGQDVSLSTLDSLAGKIRETTGIGNLGIDYMR